MPKKTLDIAVDNGNSIILQVKGNQQTLLDEVDFHSKFGNVLEHHDSIEKGHGRIEVRNTKTFEIKVNNWEKAVLVCTVFRHTTKKKNNQWFEEQNNSYYVCNEKLSALDMQSIIRGHWGIESTDHNIRDTVLFEDANKIRIKAENMMVIRSFGYNLIQANLKKKSFTAQMEANKLNFDILFEAKGIKYDKIIL